MRVLCIATFVIVFNSVGCHVIGLGKRQQDDAIATPGISELRPLPWGKVNFIHTTDTHGWLEGHLLEGAYNGDLGDFYSFTMRMKQKARHLQRDLFIVDTGDTHDGNGLSDVTSPRGKLSQPLLTHIPYDILTIGNHELYVNDVTQDVVENFRPHWKDRYLTSNVYFKDLNNNRTVSIGEKYTYFEGEFGTRVLAYGFLFDFRSHGNRSVVETVRHEIEQDWFLDSLTAHEPDIITLIGHIGLRFNEFYILIDAIRNVYPTIPIAILGGHTHIRDSVKYDPWAAGIESGRYFETVGFFSMDDFSKDNVTFARRYLDQNRQTYIYHSVDNNETEFDTEVGRNITNTIFDLRKENSLSTILGYAPQDYYLTAADPKTNSSVFHLIMQEVLPKIVAKEDLKNPPYFLLNSGGVRYDVYKGAFSKDNMYQLSPFEDEFFCIENVPREIALRLLPILNKEGEALKKRGVWPYNERVPQDQQAYLHQQEVRTPGYATTDDFGTDGDDTVHVPIPYFDLPAFVANDVPSTAFIDIIYADFIDSQLQDLLFQLSHKNWTVIKPYGNVTSSTMWVDFASKYWSP